MKIKNLDESVKAIRQYKDLSAYIESVETAKLEKVLIQFPLFWGTGSIEFYLPRGAAETLLFNEKNRLESELAGLGVEV